MTTIVFDGKQMVSDSALSVGFCIQPAPFRKIYTPEDHEYWEINGVKVVAFGIEGGSNAIELVKEKLQEGLGYKVKFLETNVSFTALILDENGIAHRWTVDKSKADDLFSLTPMLPPVAIGSGDDFALAVMSIGKSGKIAVRAAIRLDIHSDGNLQVFEYQGKPEIPSKRPALTLPNLPELVNGVTSSFLEQAEK